MSFIGNSSKEDVGRSEDVERVSNLNSLFLSIIVST